MIKTSNLVRRELPIIITAILAIILVGREYLAIPALNTIGGSFVRVGTVITAFTAGLATIALLEVHLKHVQRQTPEQWIYSVILIVSTLGFILAGILNVSWYNLIYNTLIGIPMGANWGIMTFFLISGSYRAFRVRTIESYAIALSWLLVLLALTPLGSALFGAPLASISDYLILIVTTGAFRAFVVSSAFGTIILGLRVLIGLERGAFGGGGG
jgi:hypothetical protein